MQNEELMGIRREEEMEMSDDDMEDTHDPDDSGTHTLHTHTTKALQMTQTHVGISKPYFFKNSILLLG